MKHLTANEREATRIQNWRSLAFISGCLLLLLAAAATARAQDCCGWPTNREWTAPVPALPGTEYWFYGWDSTSNGIPPMATERAMGEPVNIARRFARLKAPPLPPLPPKPKPAMPRPILIIVQFRL